MTSKVHMYSLPQEIEVWYIIPAVRKEIAKCLYKNHKLTYEKIGKILGISKSAVCQYLCNKRASKLKIPKNIKKEIEKSSEVIADDEKKALIEIQRILKIIKTSGCECQVCKKYNKGILSKCNMEPNYE